MCSNVTNLNIVYKVLVFGTHSLWSQTHSISFYSCISKTVNKDLLLLTYVHEMVSTDTIYCLQYSDSFSGDIFMRANNGPFVSF